MGIFSRAKPILDKIKNRLANYSGEAIWRYDDSLYRVVNIIKAVLIGILAFYVAADALLGLESFPFVIELFVALALLGAGIAWYAKKGLTVRIFVLTAYSLSIPWMIHGESGIHGSVFVLIIPALMSLVLDGWVMILVSPLITLSASLYHGVIAGGVFDIAIVSVVILFMLIGRLMTDMAVIALKSGIEKQRDAEELVAEVADNIPDGLALYAKDEGGKINVVFWNKSMGRLGGLNWHPGDSFPFEIVKGVSDPETQAQVMGYIQRAMSGELFVAPDRFVRYRQKKDGVWVSTKWVPYLIGGKTVGALEILQDITEQKRLSDLVIEREQELLDAYDRTLEGWVIALDLRDNETRGHSDRVVLQTVRMARAAGFSEEQIGHVRRGALLHDIGKIAVPDSILKNPNSLSPQEWEVMKQHPLRALDFLRGVEFLRPAMSIPVQHHERWNGSGYPYGLKEHQISPEARLFSVVDVFDALTSDRPYRKAMPTDEALMFLTENSGKFFCPESVDLFIKIRPWEEERIK